MNIEGDNGLTWPKLLNEFYDSYQFKRRKAVGLSVIDFVLFCFWSGKDSCWLLPKHKRLLWWMDYYSAQSNVRLIMFCYHVQFNVTMQYYKIGQWAQETSLWALKIWNSILGSAKLDRVSPADRHHCDAFSELRCPGARWRRWAPPIVTIFDIIRRV